MAGRRLAYRQGYLAASSAASVRVRLGDDGGRLNIKGATTGVVRREFEYDLPVADAELMLAELCEGPLVEKTRHLIHFAGKLWEVDEFQGANAGLVVAEVELEHEGESFECPPWLGPEVSHEVRYFNASLAKRPFSQWSENERRQMLEASAATGIGDAS